MSEEYQYEHNYLVWYLDIHKDNTNRREGNLIKKFSSFYFLPVYFSTWDFFPSSFLLQPFSSIFPSSFSSISHLHICKTHHTHHTLHIVYLRSHIALITLSIHLLHTHPAHRPPHPSPYPTRHSLITSTPNASTLHTSSSTDYNPATVSVPTGGRNKFNGSAAGLRVVGTDRWEQYLRW
jgi:FlaA1/EpsC-like NDP-sugar epimerase